MSCKIGETPSTAARGRQWGNSKEEDDFGTAQGVVSCAESRYDSLTMLLAIRDFFEDLPTSSSPAFSTRQSVSRTLLPMLLIQPAPGLDFQT